MQQRDAIMEGMPAGPGSRIIRAADAEAWENGVQFFREVRRRAERGDAAAQEALAVERARGYAEGRAEGEREAARLVVEAVAAVDGYLDTIEQEVAGLAMNVVRRVIGELDAPQVVAGAAARAILEFRRSKWLTVTVHPDAAERVSRAIDEIIKDPGFRYAVETDSGLDPHGCILASEFATVDAGIDTQLAAFADAFSKQRLEGRS